jgi:hypothetical protein
VAKERPLSPHLTIYRFRVNMITSVLFRGASSPRDASSLCASFFFRVARSSRPAAAACLVLAAYPSVPPLLLHSFGSQSQARVA